MARNIKATDKGRSSPPNSTARSIASSESDDDQFAFLATLDASLPDGPQFVSRPIELPGPD
jgi:hypothetical protein